MNRILTMEGMFKRSASWPSERIIMMSEAVFAKFCGQLLEEHSNRTKFCAGIESSTDMDYCLNEATKSMVDSNSKW